tara:strand:- start:451 stop:933 length:483 start_codon:yes stop_codon:yes gene_type:complete
MKPEVKFVGRMRALFGAPDADANAVIDEYTSVLAGQSEATLDRAADTLARTHKFRNWPTVAECLDAVAAAKRTVNTASMGIERIDDVDGWFRERISRIRIATTERQIDGELRQIEPYDIARWIAPERMRNARFEAEARRKEIMRATSADLTRRQMGEAAK